MDDLHLLVDVCLDKADADGAAENDADFRWDIEEALSEAGSMDEADFLDAESLPPQVSRAPTPFPQEGMGVDMEIEEEIEDPLDEYGGEGGVVDEEGDIVDVNLTLQQRAPMSPPAPRPVLQPLSNNPPHTPLPLPLPRPASEEKKKVRAPSRCHNCWQVGHYKNKCSNPTVPKPVAPKKPKAPRKTLKDKRCSPPCHA